MTFPLSFMTKRGSSFGFESSLVLRGRVSIGYFFIGGLFIVFEGCSEDVYVFSLYISFLYLGFVTIIFTYIG